MLKRLIIAGCFLAAVALVWQVIPSDRERCIALAADPDEPNVGGRGIRELWHIDVLKAYPICVSVAQSGHASAEDQFRLGRVALAKQSFQEAEKLIRNAALQDYAPAQRLLGYMYYRGGSGVSKDKHKAREWYTKSAEQRHDPAIIALGELDGEEGNSSRTIEGLKSLATRGNARAQAFLGRAYYTLALSLKESLFKKEESLDHANKYLSEARYWLENSAIQGDPIGQIYFGYTYERGLGTLKDEDKAAEWYQKSATHGYEYGQHLIGVLYRKKKNFGLAQNWFQKAAAQGFGPSMVALGEMQAFGEGVSPDNAAALGWYQKAAAIEDASGQWRLGQAYETGAGVNLDQTKALELFDRAAKQDHGDATVSLAKLLIYRDNPDLEKARYWAGKLGEWRDVRVYNIKAIICLSGRDGKPPDYRCAINYFDFGIEKGSCSAAYNALKMRAPKYDDPIEPYYKIGPTQRSGFVERAVRLLSKCGIEHGIDPAQASALLEEVRKAQAANAATAAPTPSAGNNPVARKWSPGEAAAALGVGAAILAIIAGGSSNSADAKQDGKNCRTIKRNEFVHYGPTTTPAAECDIMSGYRGQFSGWEGTCYWTETVCD